MTLKEGEELPRREISPEAIFLAEVLHHEARLERIHTILELALRAEREKKEKDEGPSSDDQSQRDPDISI